ncbi:MAG: autotransporter-associated beta strand repeat-containing protein [Planctomycetota bacterium]
MRLHKMSSMVLAVATMASAIMVQAAPYYWHGGSGLWSDYNWTTSSGGTVLTNWANMGDAWLSSGGNYTVTVDQNITASNVVFRGSENVEIIVRPTTAFFAQWMLVGNSSVGRMSFGGGIVYATLLTISGGSGIGTMSVSDGSVNVDTLNIDGGSGIGTMSVTGGIINATSLNINGNSGIGIMSVSGGTVSTATLSVGGNGAIETMNVTGGIINATSLNVGRGGGNDKSGLGTMSVSGGTVSASTLSVGGYAGYGGNSGVGIMNVSGGIVSTTTLNVDGNGGIGTMSVSGGNVSATTLNVGRGSGIGTISVSGGTVSAATLSVGDGIGAIVFNDGAGSVSCNLTSINYSSSSGVLIFTPYHGHIDSSEKLSLSTNPATNHGLVGGKSFVQHSQADSTGDFLSAVPDGSGFRLADATSAGSYSSVDFVGANSSSVVKVTGTPNPLNSAVIYALNVSGGNVTINAAQSLTVSGGGLILNGGTIDGGSMTFGTTQAVIYTGTSSPSTISSNMSGSRGLTKLGPGMLILAGSNAISGSVIIGNGTLRLASPNAWGLASINPLTFCSESVLQLGGNSISVVRVNSYDHSLIENTSDLPATLTIGLDTYAGTQGLGAYSGVLRDGAGSGTLSLKKDGNSTFTLKPASVSGYTGSTSIIAGTLALDFTNDSLSASNIIDSRSKLIMGGNSIPLAIPTLSIIGKVSGTTSQTFDGLILDIGLSTIMQSQAQGVVEIHLGSISRSAGGVIDFGTARGASIRTTQTNDASTGASTAVGILGGYAVISSDWAVGNGDGAGIAAYTDYVISLPPSSGTNTNNYKLSSNPGVLTSDLTVNSLKITGGSALNLGGRTLDLVSGGLLFTGTSYTISNGQLGANNRELIIWQNSSSPLTVSAVIGNSDAYLTKMGTGVLKVTQMIPNTVYLASGTLEMAPVSDMTYAGRISGKGSFTKSGESALTFTGVNTFGGTVAISAGTLNVTGGSMTGDLNVGYVGTATGTLNVLGGAVTTNYLKIGYGSNLNLSGGTVTAAADASGVGYSGGSVSNLNISGGFLTTNPIFYVGYSAGSSGNLNVSGGSFTAESGLTIGGLSGSFGTLSLSGGVLSSKGVLDRGDGWGTLSFTGGTLQVGSLGSAGTHLADVFQTATDNPSLLNVTPYNSTIYVNYSVEGNTVNSATVNISSGLTLTVASAKTLTIGDYATIGGSGNLTLTGIGTRLSYAGRNASTLSARISGAGAVVLGSGAGTLTLSGNNFYTGGTTVTGGQFVLANATGSATGTGPVFINGGVLSGTGTASGNVTINVGGTLSPGNSIGTMGITGSLNLGGTSDFQIDVTSLSNDKVVGIKYLTYGGTLKISNSSGSYAAGQNWDLFDFSSGSQSGQFLNNGVFNTTGDGTNLPLLTGLKWMFDYPNGVLSIASTLDNDSILTFGSNSASFGRVLVGTSTASVSLTLNKTGTFAGSYSGSNSNNGINGPASGTANVASNPVSASLVNNANGTSAAGAKTFNYTIANTANTADTGGIKSVTITGNVLSLRSVTGTVDLGVVHTGTSLSSLTKTGTFTSGGSHTDTTDVLVDGSLSFTGTSNSQTKSLSGGAGTVAASGTFYSAPMVTAESALGDKYDNVAVGYTAQVTSGIAVWTSTASGSWGTHAGWTDSGGTTHAAPGTFAGFANTDTATFNGSGSVTAIDLTGTSPSLSALSFSNSSYTLSNGSLTLNGSNGTATVTVNSGTQSINMPTTLASNANFAISGGALLLNSTISGSGGFTKSGSGRLTLPEANTLSSTGSVTIAQGTLVAPFGVSHGGGGITLATGGTLEAAGQVNRAVSGLGTINATGSLFVGDATQSGQFNQGGGTNVGGTLNIGGNALVILANDTAILGSQTNLSNGGSLTTLEGAQLGNATTVDATKILTATGNAKINSNFVNNGVVNGPIGDQWLTFTQNVEGGGATTGNIHYGKTYSPGNSPAIVSVGNVLLDPTSVLIMEFAGDTFGMYDQLDIYGLAKLDGTLYGALLGGFTPSVGDSFRIFDGMTSGEFEQIILPKLNNGLSWNTSNLYLTGDISISGVPEPSALALLGGGCLGLLGYRWRRRRQKRSLSLAGETTLSGQGETDLQEDGPAILSMPTRWTTSARRAA